MQARFYILRDNSVYIYNDRDQIFPSNIISLKGLYINQIKNDKNSEYYGFVIFHEQKSFKPRVFYHRNQEVIQDWVKNLKEQANNLSFDAKYIRGRKLGNGKFSVVYQCKNQETQEIVAMKQIDKIQLTEREREFLREETQIIKLISHTNIVQMRECYENEKYLFIIME